MQIEIEKQNINIDLEETLPNHVVQEIGNLITLSIEEGKNILIENGVKPSHAEVFLNDIKQQKVYTVLCDLIHKAMARLFQIKVFYY